MPEVAVYAPGTPMWVDLASPDVNVSKEFYASLFGWNATTVPEPEAGGYTMFDLGGKNVAAVAPLQMPGQPAAWSTYIATEDVKATTARVREAGGTVVMEPMQVMDAGWMAVYQDPTGAFFGVWQAGNHTGAGLTGQPGSFCWNELNTRDLDAAKEFYSRVFGWVGNTVGTDSMPYTEWHLGEATIGGMMNMTGMVPDAVPAHWLTYFAVADVDASVAKLKSLGGEVKMGPRDAKPGRFAVVADPAGAHFAVIQLSGERM